MWRELTDLLDCEASKSVLIFYVSFFLFHQYVQYNTTTTFSNSPSTINQHLFSFRLGRHGRRYGYCLMFSIQYFQPWQLSLSRWQTEQTLQNENPTIWLPSTSWTREVRIASDRQARMGCETYSLRFVYRRLFPIEDMFIIRTGKQIMLEMPQANKKASYDRVCDS